MTVISGSFSPKLLSIESPKPFQPLKGLDLEALQLDASTQETDRDLSGSCSIGLNPPQVRPGVPAIDSDDESFVGEEGLAGTVLPQPYRVPTTSPFEMDAAPARPGTPTKVGEAVFDTLNMKSLPRGLPTGRPHSTKTAASTPVKFEKPHD